MVVVENTSHLGCGRERGGDADRDDVGCTCSSSEISITSNDDSGRR